MPVLSYIIFESTLENANCLFLSKLSCKDSKVNAPLPVKFSDLA